MCKEYIFRVNQLAVKQKAIFCRSGYQLWAEVKYERCLGHLVKSLVLKLLWQTGPLKKSKIANELDSLLRLETLVQYSRV